MFDAVSYARGPLKVAKDGGSAVFSPCIGLEPLSDMRILLSFCGEKPTMTSLHPCIDDSQGVFSAQKWPYGFAGTRTTKSDRSSRRVQCRHG
jgi:hypothetical protein